MTKLSFPDMICMAAEKLLFNRAATGTDRFRHWYYPGLPADYKVNPNLRSEVERGMLRGLSAQQIADEIYQCHS